MLFMEHLKVVRISFHLTDHLSAHLVKTVVLQALNLVPLPLWDEFPYLFLVESTIAMGT